MHMQIRILWIQLQLWWVDNSFIIFNMEIIIAAPRGDTLWIYTLWWYVLGVLLYVWPSLHKFWNKVFICVTQPLQFFLSFKFTSLQMSFELVFSIRTEYLQVRTKVLSHLSGSRPVV